MQQNFIFITSFPESVQVLVVGFLESTGNKYYFI